MQVYKTWTNIKALLTAKSIPTTSLQYHEFTDYYTIWVDEKNISYFTEIWKDTSKVVGIDVIQNNLDKTDFENNYKANANAAYPSFDVNVTGGDVDATIEGGEVNVEGDIGVPRFRPRLYQNVVANEVGAGLEETIVNIDVDGQIDLITVNLEGVKWEVILEVDSVEIYRIDLQDMRDLHKLVLSQYLIHTLSGVEHYDNYPTPVDVITNFKIKVKNLDGGAKDVHAVLVKYREKVVPA